MLQKRIRKYTFQLNSGRMLISVLWVGLVIEVTELLQELVIGLSELQAVQSIARVRRQLNCRQISSALRHGIKTHRIMWTYSPMDCQPDGRGIPIAVRSTERRWLYFMTTPSSLVEFIEIKTRTEHGPSRPA